MLESNPPNDLDESLKHLIDLINVDPGHIWMLVELHKQLCRVCTHSSLPPPYMYIYIIYLYIYIYIWWGKRIVCTNTTKLLCNSTDIHM